MDIYRCKCWRQTEQGNKTLGSGTMGQWQEKKSGYYNIEADGSIPASLVVQKTYSVKIATSDDGRFVIGHIHESQFDPVAAQVICDKAVALGKSFDWWKHHYRIWWRNNWNVSGG